MKTLFRRVWSDPVWSKVIASLILLAAPYATWHFWPTLSEWAARSLSFLTTTTEVANWWLSILYTLSFLAVIAPATLFFVVIRENKSQPDPITNYIFDDFLGMNWRWGYLSNRVIHSVRPFCPHCDFQIYPRGGGAYEFNPVTSFQCDHCHRLDKKIGGSFSEIEDTVERLIQLKLRNGEWASVVKRRSSGG